MDVILSLIGSDVKTIALFVSFVLAALLAKNLKDEFDELRVALKQHSGDMGMATKAMNGDMLKLKNDLIDLKQDLLNKIEGLRDLAGRLEREFMAISEATKHSVESFEDKFGKILDLRKEVDQVFGKIILLENGAREIAVQHRKFNLWFSKVAQSLNKQKEAIRKLNKS